ncbi:hypothetical protein ABDK00_014015 [Niabella insulamsoli]|uniref:hypothetical protein n=1 Tax=Niabella insulamsoli TaxID=3144874 RepID=UPI0031FDABA0
MPYYNNLDCAGSEFAHVHAPCPGGREPEFGRVRQSGFIKEGYLSTIIAAAVNLSTWLTAWETGIAAGDIIVLPETSGSFDPGTPAELQGFGDRPSSNGPRTQVLSVNDPDYKLNYNFYNDLANRTDLVPFYVTSTLIHIFDKACTAYASNPVEDDLNAQIVWNFQATVISENLPQFYPVETIKPAIKYTPTTTPVVYNTILEFSADTEDTGASVTATVAEIDEDVEFQFNSLTGTTGTAVTMAVYVGVTQELTVSFPSDYIGRPFRYIDKEGVSHVGVFTNGNVNF